MRVAIFDFDGTLYKKETFQLLMSHLKTHPIVRTRYRSFFWSMLPRYIGSKMNLYPEQKMKAYSMQLYLSTLKDLSDEEFDTYFKEVANQLKKDFNQTVVDRLEQHKKDQVYVMLVSGAYTNLLHGVADDLDFDQIIGTETLPSKDGIMRNTEINHISGTIKNEKIEEALHDKDVDWANSYAYGDSYSDKSVLELVGNPVAVQPDPKMRAIAEERGWEII